MCDRTMSLVQDATWSVDYVRQDDESSTGRHMECRLCATEQAQEQTSWLKNWQIKQGGHGHPGHYGSVALTARDANILPRSDCVTAQCWSTEPQPTLSSSLLGECPSLSVSSGFPAKRL